MHDHPIGSVGSSVRNKCGHYESPHACSAVACLDVYRLDFRDETIRSRRRGRPVGTHQERHSDDLGLIEGDPTGMRGAVCFDPVHVPVHEFGVTGFAGKTVFVIPDPAQFPS